MLTLSTLTHERLKNAEHVQFHTNVLSIINTATADAIGLNALILTTFASAIAEEQDIVNMTTGSSYTPQMEENDKLRDTIFKRIRKKLELCSVEHQNSDAYKARNVVEKQLLSKYAGSVTSLPYQEETAVITGFVQDCRAFLTTEQLESIRIDSDLDDLLAVNKKFTQTYQGRVDEKAANDTKKSLRLRAATDEAYNTLALSLNFLANDPTPANHDKAAAAADVVQKINVVIRDVKARLEQRKGDNTDAITDGEEDPSTPSNPSNPSTPSNPSNPGIFVPGSSDDVME